MKNRRQKEAENHRDKRRQWQSDRSRKEDDEKEQSLEYYPDKRVGQCDSEIVGCHSEALANSSQTRDLIYDHRRIRVYGEYREYQRGKEKRLKHANSGEESNQSGHVVDA